MQSLLFTMKALKLVLPLFFLLCHTEAQDDLTEVAMNSTDNALNPSSLTLDFNLKGQNIRIDLQQNPDVPNNIPIILGRDGKMESWKDNSTNFATYIDRANNASFILQHKKMSDSETFDSTLKGSFRHDNRDYIIEPAPSNTTRQRRSAENRNIYKIIPAPIGLMDNTQDTEYREAAINTTEYVQEWAQYIKDSPGSPSHQPVRQHYEVETMFFIDYAIYDRFYKASKEIYHSNRVNDAISNIRYYYAHVLNGISLRYRSIDYFDYSLAVRLVGIYIAMTPMDSDWTFKSENRDPGYPRDFTHAYNALDDFEEWINQPHPDLPAFDQASLFTGNQLFRGYNPDRTHSRITGLADIASVCGKLRASVSQDNGIYATTQTGAHEMAHNLGSYHDGQGNNCRFEDQFVMASAPGELTDSNYKNAFTFSYCSMTYFREYILLLNLNDRNCMLERGVSQISQGELDTHLLRLPGEKYTLDQQCQHVFGKESYYCGGHLRDLEVCRKMYCYEPNSRKCYGRTEQRAAAGTPCGNKMWCQSGDCVYSSRAPQGEEFCRNGDFRGTFVDGRTCAQIIRDAPWECYTEAVAGDCCASCAKVMDNSNPDCKYGDKSSYCMKIKPYDCYTEQTKMLCCKACANLETGITGCEYGDRASWCPTSSLPSCYADTTCCKTCELRRNQNKPECPFGDKVTWCNNQDRSRCYERDIKDRCCDTCGRHATGPPGCEYGDRSRYCTQADCNSVTTRQNCCSTCRSYIPPQPPPASPSCTDDASWCPNIRSSDCYSSDRTCCRTCSRYLTNSQDCKYGDMASWCSSFVKSSDDCKSDTVKRTCCMACNIIPKRSPTLQPPTSSCINDEASWCRNIPTSYCYNAQTEKTCCATCRARKTGPTGCEYGDMRTWCSPQYCSTNRNLCCKTCG